MFEFIGQIVIYHCTEVFIGLALSIAAAIYGFYRPSITEQTVINRNGRLEIKERTIRPFSAEKERYYAGLLSEIEKILPNITKQMHQLASVGVTVDSFKVAMQEKGISATVVKGLAECYEYITTKHHLKKQK